MQWTESSVLPFHWKIRSTERRRVKQPNNRKKQIFTHSGFVTDKQNEKKRVRLSFYVDEDFFKKLQRIKNYKDSNEFNSCNTYEDIFKMLLNTHFRSKFNIGGRF